MNVCGNRRIFLELSLSLQPVEGGEIGGKRKVVKRDVRGVLIYSNEQGRIMKERGKERERGKGEWGVGCFALQISHLLIFLFFFFFMCLSYENLSPLWLEETVEQELERGEKSGKGGNLWISNL